jgi:alkylhydroperoxidase/carboxymuconolactone decarboxylase family protein YurZ
MSDRLLETGRSIRGEVIGRERSEAALHGASDFDRPFQDLALRYCWGEVWGRPGLDRRTRSIVNLAMLGAMGRAGELGAHVRGALTNGVSADEIREIFLQLCIYAGVPAAGEAFRVARAVLEERSPAAGEQAP